MDNLNLDKIKYLMMERQHFLSKADESEYEKMFRSMSPVHTKYWIVPGSPPIIEHRKKINDYLLNSDNRKNRIIIKGRFQGGNIGYIYADELPLYMTAYKKEIRSLSENDELILNTIESEGPMNIGLLKEITGLLSKEITPCLHKMQKAFVLFEDQVDNEWDRSWYILEDEFEEAELDIYDQKSALAEIIKRFSYNNVMIDETMIRSFTKLRLKDINDAIKAMIEDHILIEIKTDDKRGLILKEDLIKIKNCDSNIPDDIYILDLNDYLIKSNEIYLKEEYSKKDYKTLYYIMNKGYIIGAVYGNFRFGPDDLEDVRVDLSKTDREKYKSKIIEEILKVYGDEKVNVKRYCGKSIT